MCLWLFFYPNSQTYVLSTNSDRVPRQPELCTAHQRAREHHNEYTYRVYYILRRGLVYFAPGTSGLFCTGVWFILRRGLVHFASHLVFFAPELYLLFILLIFLYSSFFSYLKKNYTVYITQKKEYDCALLPKLKKTVDLQLASCYTTDSDGIVQQPS